MVAGPTPEYLEPGGEDEVVVRLVVHPGAGRRALVGRHGDALKVKVAAPPEHGRANDECVALLADTLGVTTDAVEVVGGGSSRSKRVRVTGLDREEVARLLEAASARPPSGRHHPGNAGPARDVR